MADAQAWIVRDQAEGEHQQAASWAQDLPYLPRDKTIDRPNQVWAADITYIPMRRGFLYLVAIIHWSTRRVLSWRLSNTLMAGSPSRRSAKPRPGVFNTDQAAGSWHRDHEWVYLRPAVNGLEQKRSLDKFFDWYNRHRPHQALGWQTPDEAYFGTAAPVTAEAA
jgi:putative transposase